MEYRLTEAESLLADIIWANEPLTSGRLVELCGEALEWKKSTTYTMLKRLCEKGAFQNEGGIIGSKMSSSEFYAEQGRGIIERSFDGSLPKFLAAFADTSSLSNDEIDEIQSLIDEYRRNNG